MRKGDIWLEVASKKKNIQKKCAHRNEHMPKNVKNKPYVDFH